MLLRLLFVILTVLPISQTLQAGVWDNLSSVFTRKTGNEIPSIRVLLAHNIPGTDVEVRGKYSLYDPNGDSYISSRFAGKRKYMQTMGDGLKWGEAFPGLYQLKITPDEASTVTVIDNNQYIGPLFVYDVGGTISIVNQVPVETYVQSILSNYNTSTLHRETLAALAIVARTNAYFQSLNPRTNFWSVDAQKTGFKGNPQPTSSTTTEEATKVTRYMIMSNTGIYEGHATPFPAEFAFITPGQPVGNTAVSKISLDEANAMANQGAHAAQILAKAFPGATIMLSRE